MIVVADTGPLIAKIDMAHLLFELYAQVVTAPQFTRKQLPPV